MNTLIIKIITAVVLIFLVQNCSGNKALMKVRYDEGVWGNDEYVCMRQNKKFHIFRVNSDATFMAMDSIFFDGYLPQIKFLTFDPIRKRLYFFAGDSVFAFDKRTGLLTTLTKGGYSNNVNCSRLSPGGKYIAFSASPWNYGLVQFWRLVIVNVLEGGIEFFCDSLLNPYCFRWMRPEQISYLVHRIDPERWDTTVSIYDIGRRSVGAGRGDVYQFDELGCHSSISPGSKWKIINKQGIFEIVPISEKNGLPNK